MLLDLFDVFFYFILLSTFDTFLDILNFFIADISVAKLLVQSEAFKVLQLYYLKIRVVVKNILDRKCFV